MKVLITAGPTYEKIDPVRFIGNYSSGKMGFAIAEECLHRGFDVVLISGPVALSIDSQKVNRIDVESAAQMYEKVMENISDTDIAIFCAAVADFTPETFFSDKVKRANNDLIIKLKPTKDIAAAAGATKKENQFFVGFALETSNELENALRKMERKKLDLIVLNSLKDKGAGFGGNTNKVTIIHKNGEKIAYPLDTKRNIAKIIMNQIVDRL